MFNFYVVWAGRDTAGIPHKGKNSKPHHYKKRYKNRRTSRKNEFLEKNRSKISTKKNETNF